MVGIKSRFRVCELFDIPIYIDISLVFLLLFFVSGGGSLISGLVCAALLMLSITLHELGHSLTARAFGYETNDITLSLLGGCASLIALPRRPSQEFLTAVAGPSVSFALSGVAVALLSLLKLDGSAFALVWQTLVGSVSMSQLGDVVLFGTGHEPVYVCRVGVAWLVDSLIDFGFMNAMLGAFNLLPGFPMDGGRVFRSAMRSVLSRSEATHVAMIVGRVVAIGIGLVGLYRLSNGHSWGIVTIMIAWMIWKEGYREYLMARMESDFRNWTQRDFNARVSPPPYDR